MDKVLERAKKFAEDFKRCGYSNNYQDILSQDLDVVHICTPHYLHKTQVIQALKAGINVLTEKPLAITLDDADKMIEVANKSDKKFGVIFQNRYIEGIIEAKKVINERKLGKIKGAWSLLTWWRPPSYYDLDWKGSWEKEGGGVLIDQAIHSIDLVQYLIGEPVKWIEGDIYNRVLKKVEVEDVADAAICFENDSIYSLFATNYYTHNAPIKIEITGEKGKINIVGFDVEIEVNGKSYEVEPAPATDVQFPGQGYWGPYHMKEILQFYDSVINDKPVDINGQEGRKALEIVLGIYKSSREGKKIYVR